MTSLTEAATAAANAAAQALSSMQSRSSTGLESATRILKSPDVFTGEDPMVFQTWKFQFSSWLSFGDQRFQEVLEKVEALRDDPADTSSFTTEEKELSTKLYTVLATYLKGRCFNMVKAGMKAKNGFLLWRQLHKEFLPSTRQRTLALAQALSAYPTFPKEKSSLECVLAFEQMVQQFEESSMSNYPDELKSATLIRCCHAKVREYLQLTVTDSTTYGDIREAILSHDRASKVWSQETVLRSLTQGPAEQRTDGPTPMEVDRVFMEKGKGKDKGKFKGGKGKGGDWTSAWGFLRGKGRGRGFKGKGKDKGKQKGKKGKSKGKNKGKNKSKGKLGQNQCSECLQYGHWARDCPNKMRVNQVEQSEQVPQQAQQPSQGGQAQFPGGQRGPCSSTAASSSNSTVRRVFNIGLPSLSSESMASGSVRVIFEEVVEEIIEENLVNNIEEMNYNEMEEEVVILDSGSDVSLLPKRHQRNLEGSTLGCRLQNCQGGTLEVAGVKHAELHVQARGGQGAVLQHRFVVGDVQSCIMSLGELYQAGWHIDKDGDELSLLPPDDSMKVPVFYKNKSLAIRAHVRCIREVLQEEEAGIVRAVIQLNNNFNLEQFNRWQTTTDGVPYLLTKRSRFADPRPVFGGLWSYRSTFYKRIEEGRWYVAEIGNKFMDNEEPFGSIPEIAGDLRDVDILTVLSKGDEPMDYFGRIMDEGGIEAMPVDNEDDGFLGVVQLQPEQDLRHGGDLRPEEVQGEQQEVEGHEVAVPVEAEAEEDRVVVGEMELTRYSMVRDLRRACRYLGVSQAGSKEKLLKRLVETNKIALRRQALEVAQRQYEGEMVQAEVVQPAARLPTPHERKMHEATHLPFRQWCGHCVAAKSKDNVHKHQEDDQRERPTVQVDFGHAECGEVLIAVDYWTKTCMAEVMSKKSVNAIGESLANFLGELNYGEAIEICCDNEPVLAAGVKLTKDIRTRNGLETIVTCGKAYDKGRTSAAERYIRILRNQAKCIVSFVEEKVKVKIPPDAMLQAWAFQHGSWLVNKFHKSSTTGLTAFQCVHGRPYRGRICTFGESVYGHDAKQSKYRLQWRKGLWLGKDSFDHDLVAVGDNEVLRCKAVRKASEEWDGEAILGLKVSPENLRRGSKTVLKQGRLPPVDVQLLGGPPHDKDAEDVKKYAEQNPNEDKELDTGGELRDGEQGEAGQVGGEAMEEEALPSRASSSMAAHPRGSMQAGEALLLLQGGQAMETVEQGQRREVPEGSEESMRKSQRLDEETPIPEPESKKSKTLYLPAFAGQVRQVIEDVEIYVDEEEEVEWQIEDEIDLTEYTEKDGPPEVSKEQLEELDIEAMLKEVEKLKEMKVIGSIPPEMSVDDALQLDTKNVFDWRFRQNQWTRRCRIVAREFKDSVSTVDTFAPTTPWSAVRTLLALGTVMKPQVAVFDVSGAFLLVPQQEFVIIKVPGWIQQLQPDGEPVEEFWMLKRCLPGQRNAAVRWSDYFGGLAKEKNFEACKSIPTIYRHQQRQMLMNVHIDDILLIGTTKDCEWFEEEFSKVLRMKKDGPCGIGDNQTVMYLKRELEFRNNEFYLRTNRKYVPKLAEMMEVTERRNKTLPYHPGLDTYDPKSVDEKELLNEEDAKKFRSGLGICLYLSHGRIDIQFAVKILSSYMSRPTKNAYCGLRKLACYLKSTADFEIEFSGSYEYQSIFDWWGQHEGDPQRRARYNLELFSDSDWATSKSSRKSTSAGIMFLNGLMIHSHSKSQTSIALSSCEAELLAATGLLAEGLQLKQLVRFCLRIEESKFENDEEVEMKLYLDSTSAQAMISRLGPGRSKHISTRLLWSQQGTEEAMVQGWKNQYRQECG